MKPPSTSHRTISGKLWFAAAFALAMALAIAPIPESLLLYRPDFVTLVLIYCCLYHPEAIGVVSAFVVGLLVDVLTFGIMGQHALAKVIVAYCCIRLSPKWNGVSMLSQAFFVMALLLVHSITISIVRLYGSEGSESLVLWISPLTGATLWLIVSYVIQTIKSVRNVTAK